MYRITQHAYLNTTYSDHIILLILNYNIILLNSSDLRLTIGFCKIPYWILIYYIGILQPFDIEIFKNILYLSLLVI